MAEFCKCSASDRTVAAQLDQTPSQDKDAKELSSNGKEEFD
jgi:hypothetical protein